MKITLAPEELAYLHRASFLPDRLQMQLASEDRLAIAKSVINLSREEIDALRDLLGIRLQQVGFDRNYSPTPEGTMLENLMDRL